MTWPVITVLIVGILFALKVCHDERAYQRAWRQERAYFQDWVEAQERRRGRR